MSHAAKGALRSMKNVAKGYSDVQVKVREATSNDPWGPSTELMREIASRTNYDHEFQEIMSILEKRLNDHGKNWRHVHKALILIEYLVLCGNDRVRAHVQNNLYQIKTLREFQYRDESGADQGNNVRQKAKELTEILTDETKLQTARSTRREVMGRLEMSGYANNSYGSPSQEDEEMRRAIQESLRTAERERTSRHGYGSPSPVNYSASQELSEEEQLQRAIELSKREEEERQRRRGGGGQPRNGSQPPAEKPMIDLLGGEEFPIQPQATGMDPFGMPQQNPFNMVSSNPTGYSTVGAQRTGMDPFGAAPAGAPSMMGHPVHDGAHFNPYAPAMTGSSMGSTGAYGAVGVQGTGNPFGMQAPMQPYAASNMTGFNPFGAGPSATVVSPNSMAHAAQPSPPAKQPMVDLDNLGSPSKNPFAMSSQGTGSNQFNWRGEPEKKPSLMELAQNRTGGMYTAQPMGGFPTGAGLMDPRSVQPMTTGASFGAPMQFYPPDAQQNKPATNNPFQF